MSKSTEEMKAELVAKEARARQLQYILAEIYKSEKEYNEQLQGLQEYIKILKMDPAINRVDKKLINMLGEIDGIKKMSDSLLKNMDEAKVLATDEKSKETNNELYTAKTAEILARQAEEWGPKGYDSFMANYDKLIKFVDKYKIGKKGASKIAQQRVTERFPGKDLLNLAITPVQRLPRFELFVKEMIKNVEETSNVRDALVKSKDNVSNSIATINENIRKRENEELAIKNQPKIPEKVKDAVKEGAKRINDKAKEARIALAKKLAPGRVRILNEFIKQMNSDGVAFADVKKPLENIQSYLNQGKILRAVKEFKKIKEMADQGGWDQNWRPLQRAAIDKADAGLKNLVRDNRKKMLRFAKNRGKNVQRAIQNIPAKLKDAKDVLKLAVKEVPGKRKTRVKKIKKGLIEIRGNLSHKSKLAGDHLERAIVDVKAAGKTLKKEMIKANKKVKAAPGNLKKSIKNAPNNIRDKRDSLKKSLKSAPVRMQQQNQKIKEKLEELKKNVKYQATLAGDKVSIAAVNARHVRNMIRLELVKKITPGRIRIINNFLVKIESERAKNKGSALDKVCTEIENSLKRGQPKNAADLLKKLSEDPINLSNDTRKLVAEGLNKLATLSSDARLRIAEQLGLPKVAAALKSTAKATTNESMVIVRTATETTNIVRNANKAPGTLAQNMGASAVTTLYNMSKKTSAAPKVNNPDEVIPPPLPPKPSRRSPT